MEHTQTHSKISRIRRRRSESLWKWGYRTQLKTTKILRYLNLYWTLIVVLDFPNIRAWKNLHMKWMLSLDGSTRSSNKNICLWYLVCAPSQLLSQSLWILKVRSIPPFHGWLDSRITSPSLAWIISTLLVGWQYFKSQITLLTPFNL